MGDLGDVRDILEGELAEEAPRRGLPKDELPEEAPRRGLEGEGHAEERRASQISFAIIFSKDFPASSKDFPELVNPMAGSRPLLVANAELGKDLGKELGKELVFADGETA